MENVIPAQDMAGLQFICADNPRMADVVTKVIDRQRRSIAMHGLALESLAGVPSLLAYEAPLLPVCIRRAQGARITDIDGNDYIDCHMAYTASILGHNPAPVVQAVQEATVLGIAGGHFFEQQVELGELVRQMVPGLERVAFFNTGGEAISAAVRLARCVTGKTRVAKFEGCYHGSNEIGLHNSWMVLTGHVPDCPLHDITPLAATGGVPTNPDFLILSYNSPVAIELIEHHASELGCIVMDPLPPFMTAWPEDAKRFAATVCDVAANKDVPVIFDEVVCGFRLAMGGAREWAGVAPQMSCYGKITSGLGIPLSVLGGDARFLDMARTSGLFRDYFPQKAWVASTLNSSFLPVVASLAQLRYLTDNYDHLMGRLDRHAAELGERLADFAQQSGIPVSLVGHARMGLHLGIGEIELREKTYRHAMQAISPSQFKTLLAMSFYLRLQGIYTKLIPTMNLSAAHTEADIEQLTDGICKSLLQMQQDGMLPG